MSEWEPSDGAGYIPTEEGGSGWNGESVKCSDCGSLVRVRQMPPNHPPTLQCDCKVYCPMYNAAGGINYDTELRELDNDGE